MSECKTTRDLAEQLDSEIEETFSPLDPGFWKISQIESDEEEIFDFDAAPKKAALKMSIYRFRSRGRAACKETTLVQ